MSIRQLYRALCLAALFAVSGLSAATLSNLYQTELLVTDQLAEPTAEQQRQGLVNVLIKSTGKADIASDADVKTLIDNAGIYLNRFSYQSTRKAMTDARGQTVLAHRLKLEFDGGQVEQWLRQNQIAVLGPQRPGVLVWLVHEHQGTRDYLLDGDVTATLEEIAAVRGLPLQYPLFDLDDQQNLPVSDLWAMFADSVKQASQRYQPDAILVGRITAAQNTPAKWRLYYQQSEIDLSSAAVALTDQAEDVISEVADRLLNSAPVAQDFSYQPAGVVVTVAGVEGIGAYTQLMNYLNSMAVVSSVVLEAAEAGVIRFRLTLDGSEQQLRDAIRLEPRLVPQGIGTELEFRWQG